MRINVWLIRICMIYKKTKQMNFFCDRMIGKGKLRGQFDARYEINLVLCT